MTFETDPHKVQRIAKRIGEKLTAGASRGIGLLETPKSKGMIQMEEAPRSSG
ncbi:MAG: hypothetical protein ACE37J_07235 [Pikeienuella sp.]|uniref:hypothetical protein n=1 Tax=Pikeienuella sp. TaxID=2831957 RepID=UPI00391A4AF4